MDYGKSFFEKFAGKEIPWLYPDTEEEYKNNLTNNRDLLSKNGWLDRKFTYKFNSNGFRCNELDPAKSSAMFLGCSHTMGTGIPLEDTWAHIVSKAMGLECYNLAVGGGSNDTAFRLCNHYIGNLRPKVIVLLKTYNTRFETIKGDGTILQHFLNKTTVTTTDEILYKHLLLNNANLDLNKTKNTFAIRYLSLVTKIPLVELDVEQFPRIDLARDLGHSGTASNKQFADTVLNHINRML